MSRELPEEWGDPNTPKPTEPGLAKKVREQADEIKRLRADFEISRTACKGFQEAVQHQQNTIERQQIRIAELTAALEYYANPIHWMGETENSEFQTVFIAGKLWDMNGWSVAEKALASDGSVQEAE